MTEAAASAVWARALLAVALLAVDPQGLRGLWLRARSGPARDRLIGLLGAVPLPLRRLPPSIGEEALDGGLDLAATLGAGRRVATKGLLAEPAALVLTMAERCPPGLAARLGQALDGGTHALVALDEGAEPDEGLPPALADRLGLFVALDDIPAAATAPGLDLAAIARARDRLASVVLDGGQAEALTVLAARAGIASLRAPLLAMAAARAAAALAGRTRVASEDLEAAAALVLAHRATVLPEPEAAPEPEAEPEAPLPEAQGEAEAEGATIPEEILLEAVRAALPPDLLAQLAAGRAARRAMGAAGAGAARKGNRRGRPLPSRPGRLDGTARVDLVATLRAAAPWQPMRRAAAPAGHLLHIRPGDIRVKRYVETSDRLLVFAVDASGSSAVARLAEAKGAVELLLAQAYARRDHVALVAFRGTVAEVLLPPTRSLVQTKRRLAALPGGGGTPLAHGLRAAMGVAEQARARGMTPTLALLTDGRANIALDGTANRPRAAEDAARIARALRSMGMPALVIDTATRPQDALRALAADLDGAYVALPRADARRLSAAVAAALGD